MNLGKAVLRATLPVDKSRREISKFRQILAWTGSFPYQNTTFVSLFLRNGSYWVVGEAMGREMLKLPGAEK